jgi:hypothetical protein
MRFIGVDAGGIDDILDGVLVILEGLLKEGDNDVIDLIFCTCVGELFIYNQYIKNFNHK